MKKMNFGEGGAQGFLVRHVEKMVLIVAALLVALFFYRGFSMEGFDESKTPKELQARAESARSHVLATTWEEVQEERSKDDIIARLRNRGETLPRVHEAPYTNHLAWLPPAFPLRIKRTDPELYPPIEVEAVGQYAALAMRRTEADIGDPINDAAVEPDVKKIKPKRSRRSHRRSRFGEEGGYGFEGMEGYGMEGEGYEGYGMESEGGEGMYGYGQGGASGSRRPSKEQLDNIKGYRPGGTAGMEMDSYGSSEGYAGEGYPGASGSGAGSAVSTGPIAKGYYFVAVKALVPYKKQWDEFERAFADTGYYVPARDTPKYVFYKVQRAEVPDDQSKPLQWKTLRTLDFVKATRQWQGSPSEIADPRYVDPKLTNAAPPVMMRDLKPLMLHSDVPRKPFPQEGLQMQEREDPLDSITDDAPGVLDQMQRVGQAGQYGEGYEGGYGMEGYEGGYGMEGYEGGYGMEGYEGGYGEEGYGGYGQMGGVKPPEVDYKLFRFYDFDVKPGKEYKYRVQLWLEDPNHPKLAAADPAIASLSDDVVKRLQEVREKEANDPKSQRIYWRESDWSEPSNEVSVPKPYQVLGGLVTRDRMDERREADGRIIKFPKRGAEPEAKMMAIVWDPQKAVDVPAEITAYRGSLLNFHKKVDVLHPLTLNLKTLEQPGKTNNLLLDIRGGETMPVIEKGSSSSEPLQAPGEFLLMDERGNLKITKELDDLEVYRQNFYPEEVVEAKPAMEEGMYGGFEEMYEGYEGGYGRER